MGRINTKKQDRVCSGAHTNFMGGNSWDISNPLLRLRIVASSCFFGEPKYYHRDNSDDRVSKRRSPYNFGHITISDREIKHLRSVLDAKDPYEWRSMNPTEIMEKAIDEALDCDFNATLNEAVRLRNEENIRTTPQVILVRAAHHKSAHGNPEFRRLARLIIRRADEPAVGLAYHLWRYSKGGLIVKASGRNIPTRLKKVWRDALEKFNEYHLAKYRMESRQVKTVDVVNLVHPASDAVNKLVHGELKTTGTTWESIISKMGSNKESWTKAIDVMGHMALLRNLRNLSNAKVNPACFIKKLVDGAERGKQLPFRYYSAYKAVESYVGPQVLDAVEDCLFKSLGNLPKFNGRVMSLCDNSGSAWGSTTSSMGTMCIAEIGNITSVITGMASDEGHIGVFGDRLETFPIRKRSSAFDQVEKVTNAGRSIGHATENGIWLFWNKVIREKQHWDHIFIYSDMQAGHGGLYGHSPSEYRGYAWPSNQRNIDVPKLVNTYRHKVNPNVMVYFVQIAGYQDTIMPEYYNRTFILGGWGDGLLRFAAEMSSLHQLQF